MASGDEHQGHVHDHDTDFEGQGRQEEGGAKKRAKLKTQKNKDKEGNPPPPPVPCCQYSKNHLTVTQRKVMLLSGMLYVVIDDSNHRDTKTLHKFMGGLYQDLSKLKRGDPFNYKEIGKGN